MQCADRKKGKWAKAYPISTSIAIVGVRETGLSYECGQGENNANSVAGFRFSFLFMHFRHLDCLP